LKLSDLSIGQRQIRHRQESRTRQPDKGASSTTISEQRAAENAVLPSEIKQLPDLSGYLKLASSPTWQRVQMSLPRI
jgi:hypothetical protein